MNLTYQFRRLVLLQVLLGIVAFCIAELNPGMLVVAGSLGLLSWKVTEGPSGRPLPKWLINLGLIAAGVWLVFDLAWQRGNVIVVMGHFMIWLQVLLLYAEKRNRDYAMLLVLSLMMMTGASVLSVSMIYGAMLAGYCIVALLTLLTFHLKSNSDAVVEFNRAAAPAGARTEARPTFSRACRWQFRSAAMLVGIGCALVGLIVFVVMPRMPGSALDERYEGPAARPAVGFTNHVNLTTSPSGEGGQEPVLNMTVKLHGETLHGHTWLLRGAALDEYDPEKRTWRRGAYAEDQTHLYRLRDGAIELARLAEDEPSYEADITLRRTGYRTLFTHHPTASIESPNLGQIMFNTLDQQMSAGDAIPGALVYKVRWPMLPPHDLQDRYEQTLDPGERPERPQRHVRESDPQMPAAYARHWPVQEQRVAELTLGILREQGLDRDVQAEFDPRDERIANALRTWLQDNFTYRLYNPTGSGDEDPMIAFLFDRREGHCELFASALAAMTRSIGMQARVITGFRVSEYNRIGEYYIVRRSHAHAWTEINLGPSTGWRTFDPSPPEDVRREHVVTSSWTRSVRELYEHMEFAWISSVVAYDRRTRHQLLTDMGASVREIAAEAQSPLARFSAYLQGVGGNDQLPGSLLAALAMVVTLTAAGLVLLVRALIVRRRRRANLLRDGTHADPRRLGKELGFYFAMTELLEQHGYRRPDWQCPLAFARTLHTGDGERFGPVVRLTEWFYRYRYGHGEPDAYTQKRIRGQLRRLETSLAADNGA